MSIVPWSFSKINAYNTCPRQFYELKIARNFVETESTEMLWGTRVHEALEAAVLHGTPVPDSMSKYGTYAAQLLRAPGDKYPELKLAVDANLEYTGFDSENCWGRGVADIVIVHGDKAFVGDYKTGKKKPQSRQLDLMAALIFVAFPEVTTVLSAFLWLQYASLTAKTYARKDIEPIWDAFRQDVSQMLWSEENNVWPARQSGLCRNHCPVVTCPHNGRRSG